MLELLEWPKKDRDHAAGPGSDPAPAPRAGPGEGDSAAAALADLGAQLEAAASAKTGGAELAHIQDAGAPHFAALLARSLALAEGTPAAREVAWKSLFQYQSRLAQALCTSAGAAFTAASAARAMLACRVVAKLHLVHYTRVPGRLWRVAYTIYASAEKNQFARAAVHAQADRRLSTTVEHEFVRLLMLSVSAPDMMAPEEIEVADRIVEQLGPEFTLRQHGVADNPFCFEPGSEFAPRRANGWTPTATARFFGPGVGYDSLQRLARQLGTGKREEFRAFGKDIAPSIQLSTVQHLLTFWRDDCPYAPPDHEPASGSVHVVHQYGQVWQHLSHARKGAGELSLAEYTSQAPQRPETWALRGTGGSELGAEPPQASRAWVKCGALVGLSMGEEGEGWVGLIRRMHAEPNGGLLADIAVMSRKPRAVSLREVLEQYEDSVFTNASSRQFGHRSVQAVILADGSDSAHPPNLLLAPEHWREGRVYELQEGEALRYLRALQAVRRGGDYVRATFEWVDAPA
jgi:hypothetical protein